MLLAEDGLIRYHVGLEMNTRQSSKVSSTKDYATNDETSSSILNDCYTVCSQERFLKSRNRFTDHGFHILCIGKLIYHAMPWICLSMLFRSFLQHYCSQRHTACRRGSYSVCCQHNKRRYSELMLHYNEPYLCSLSSVQTFLRGWCGSSDVGNIKF